MVNNKSSRLYSDGTNWKATSVTGVNLLGCGLGVWFFRFLSLTYFDMTTSLASTSEAFHFFFFLENWISKTIKSGLVHAIFHACKMSSWEYFVKYKTLQNPFRFRFTGISDWMVKSDDRFSFIFCRIIGLLLTICTGHLHRPSAPAERQFIREHKRLRVLGTRGKVLCGGRLARQRGWVYSASDQTRKAHEYLAKSRLHSKHDVQIWKQK